MNLCTLEELKEFLNIEKDNTNQNDNTFKIYIEGVSETIIGMIGRDIFAQDYIEKYKGSNSNALILNNYPINTINSVEYVLDGEILNTVSEEEYDINTKSGILYKDTVWFRTGGSSYMSGKINFPRRHIRITYNAGHKEVPFDLKLLALELIQQQIAINNSDGAKKGLKSYSISDVRMEWKDEIKLNMQQIAIINKYRGLKI
ncbi:head-tail connector protein [Clostridium botulinum]|uniref:Putative phage associated protein n=1 Tax=Clostridium botulinum CFSAN001627 TaxID=1232189 RepID=M1ZT41_CLOBO|nr:head-tail connector protein [Clostridium botulinum]EKN42972.1 putative phage associated protein [Clostridium botulinum CFSAN001627]AXG97747.1 phage gp6-like head-tail connector protein [Clostridium botulinum]MBY6773621.1 phage gp6-like head-tail connector protein [Clostridium botulinum]MBY6850344.1 phage gp6-like head-tail connector protein [Clostridium botulinum]MBY6857404.1 phage gp6-like head-tail connector protein [Clostridium botulinum]